MTNVLVILADDLRADLLPFMPFVNGVLRAEGTSFSNMRCSVPSCQPARAALLTGQYARGAANRVYENGQLPAGNPAADTLPVWLSKDEPRVKTAMFGKYLLFKTHPRQPGWNTWHVLHMKEQSAIGYTISDGVNRIPPPANQQHQLPYLAGQVRSFIHGAPLPEERWFCVYAPTNPHVSVHNVGGVTSFSNNPLPSSVRKFTRLRWPLDLLTDTTDKPSWIVNKAQFTTQQQSVMRRNIRQQVREAHDLDGAIADIYGALQDSGQLDDTFIIFATDSGVFYGEQRMGGVFPSQKNAPYDVVAKVPCIIRGPLIPAGAVATTSAVIQDLTATILAIFDKTPAATVPLAGTDLRPFIASPDPERATLYEHVTIPPLGVFPTGTLPDGYGVVTSTRKLVRWIAGTGNPGPTSDTDLYEMYYLDDDPAEKVNLGQPDNPERPQRDLLEARLDLEFPL